MSTQAVLDASVLITGVLVSQGWATQGITTVQGAYTPLASDAVVLCNAAGTPFTVTLADCTQPPYVAGQRYTIIKTDSSANTVVVQGTGPQTIAGGTVTLTASSAYVSVVFDATSLTWQIWGTNITSGPPTGAAGGALTGTYPNPGLAVPVNLSEASTASVLTVTNTQSAPNSTVVAILTQTAGDRAFGIQVTGDSFARFRVNSDGTILLGPGSGNQDVQLSRTSAGVITIQPVSGAGGLAITAADTSTSVLTVTNTHAAPGAAAHQIVAAASGDRAIGIQVTGDGFQRYRVDSAGKLSWGPGNLTQDTDLYRASAGVLQTDNSLVVSVNLTVSGQLGASLNAGGNTITSAGTPGVTLPWLAGIFGDGSDGSVNFNGTSTVLGLTPSGGVYTLTRDIFCTTVQIGGGVTATTITTNGWRIFCAGTVTIAANGTISAVGNSATAGSNQHTAAGSTGTGTLGGGRAGSAGVATGTANTATASTGVATGAPGAGGNGTTGTGGASAGAPPSTDVGWFRTPFSVLGTALFNSSAAQRVDGGGGGSGGGGDGTNFGGGGGSGGGVVAVMAWAIVNSGAITAAGGNGGTPSTVVTNGGCGGGGGGAGGLILLYTAAAVTGAGTTNVAGGNGGTKVTNGTGTATNGSNGANGNYLNIVLT